MAKNYEELSTSIIDLVGGKENVSLCTHCVTRLRLNIIDKSDVKEAEIKKLKGVLGTQWSGEQLQIIIGQDVHDLYTAVCKNGGFAVQEAIDENLDGDLKIRSFKDFGSRVVQYISGSMFPYLPIAFAAGLCKTLATVIGPDVLKLVTAESDIYMVLNMLYNAAFYFLPVFLGYGAAKALKIDPCYGIFLGALLIVPDFINLVGARETVSIFGIPAPVASYAQSFLPIILGMVCCKYVLQIVRKISPKVLSALLVPLLTVLIMTPIMFCLVAPIGNWLGNLIGSVLVYMSNSNPFIRAIGTTLVGAFFPFLITFGMHILVVTSAVMVWMQYGYETFVFPPIVAYSWAVYGIALGAFLKLKDKDNKSEALSSFLSGFLGGVSEPSIYGVALKYKNAMLALMIAGGIGGLYCGIFQPKAYVVGNLINIFSAAVSFAGGGSGNLVSGLIMSAISFVAAVILSYLFIKEDNKAEE